MSEPPLSDRPFVGRAAERAALEAHVAAARDGHGRVVLLTGEPGIGKTRLVEETMAALPPARVLWGRCHETEGAPAHWPWMQAFRGYAAGVSPERLQREAGDVGVALARIVPAVRTRRTDVGPVEITGGDSEADRFLLFDAVTTFLRAIGRDELLVVVLDDLHWADSESLLLLTFVARDVRDARVLVVGTYREAELRQAAAVPRILGDLARTSHRLAIGGLTVADVARYVHSTTGRVVGDDVVQAIHRATAGNAYFVTEVVQLLESEGRLGAGAALGRIELPAGVRELIHRRIDPLPDATRDVLTAAAVLGREFDVVAVAAIVEAAPSAVLDALAPAFALGAIADVTETPGRVRFAHALLQETLLAELGAGARADLHRRAGEALERLHADAIDPVLGEIAHHFFQAAPLGAVPKAIDYATRAGYRAYAQLGYEEAAGHFERALQASRGGGVDAPTRLRLLMAFGQAQDAADDQEGARATLIEAARLAHDLGDSVTFASAVALAGSSAQTGRVDVTIIRLLEEAEREVGPGDSRRRAFLLAQLARCVYFSDTERRHQCSEEALAIARRLQDGLILLTALQARHFALWEPGTVAQRRKLGEEAVALSEHVGLPLAVAEVYAWRILDHLELGDMAVVEDTLRRYRELAARCRLPRVRWHLTLIESTLAQLAGRLADAERLAHRAVGIRQPTARNNVAAFYGVQLYLVYEELDRLEELRPSVEVAAERATMLPIWRAGLAHLHAMRGEHDAARRIVAALGGRDFGDLPRDGNLLGTWARLAETCAIVGDATRAAALLRLLAPYADGVVILGTTAGCLGSVGRYAGLAAHAAGRHDEAVAHFETALATNARLGAAPQLAHSQHELARTLRARAAPGDSERAVALEGEAAAAAERLGLVALARALGTVAAPPLVAPVPEPAAPRAASLRCEGDVWTIVCGDELTRVKDTKGVAYLAQLLRHPGREFHALDLGGVETLRTGDAGEMLDANARRAYKARLAELRDELAEAESFNDVGRTARLREEMDALAGELARASGLGGRARKASSDAERARLNVTRALRAVLRKVRADCPVLGRHLDRAVQTGIFCAYEPDPTFPVTWDL